MLVKVRTSPVTMTKWICNNLDDDDNDGCPDAVDDAALAPALIATAMVLRKTATFALEMMPPWTLIRMVPVTI